MAISLVNESKRPISLLDATNFANILTQYSALVCQRYGLPINTVAIAPARVAGQQNVVIVDQFPNSAMQKVALGYHEMLNGSAIAYIRADAYGSRSIFGTYSPALKLKNIIIHGERFTPGVISVAAHELAEMLVDPQINRLSAPDNQGRTWLMEPCDHTVGSFHLTANGANGVLPDFTTPSFYDDKHGSKPYSYLNVPPAPFTLVSGAYGYWKDSMGTLHKL